MDKTVFHRVRAINNSVAFDLGVCRTDNTNMFAESYFEGNHIHAINMTDNSRPLIVASRMLDNDWASSPPTVVAGSPPYVIHCEFDAGERGSRGGVSILPATSIVEESVARDTIGNLWFVRLLHTEPRRLRRLAIVTSNWHVERTRAIADPIFV